MDDKRAIFTDGAVVNNGRATKGGIAFYCPKEGYRYCRRVEGVGSNSVTNNICELMAIEEAISWGIDRGYNDMVIMSDSQYSIKCLTEWYPGWIKSGWVNSKKKPVLNQDIIKRILALLSIAKIEFVHVRAHLDEPADKRTQKWAIWNGNDIVDKLASAAIEDPDADVIRI